MQVRQYFLFGLTTLVFGFTGQSSFAFSVTGQTQPNNAQYSLTFYSNSYFTGYLDTFGIQELKPPDIKKNDFLKILRDTFPAKDGWIFQSAQNDLDSNFNVELYSPFFAPWPNPITGQNQLSLGANIAVRHVDKNGVEIPVENKFHWIQQVRSTRGSVGQSNFNYTVFDRNFIDIPYNPKQDNPFYDLIQVPGLKATGSYFQDGPRVFELENSHLWLATLYLVELENPSANFQDPKQEKRVTIHNGISWGWQNTSNPQPPQPTQTFSGTLTAGFNENQHQINGLTPGNYFYAWTKNDLPSNQCNPNTYLTTYNNNSSWDDDDSSLVGDGFASALAGIVADDGTINLSVRAANPGGRGEDSGNYELYATVYDSKSAPPEIIVGSSGGGGVVLPRPRPGGTQQNPILPTSSSSGGWQIFNNVPGCRWYDPHTTYGFEFQALENTLFTEILDFPVGQDNRFTVSVADTILGEFSPGERLNFVSLFGAGVTNFRITDIGSLIGNTKETAFPIQLAFNQQVGSFQMRAIEETPSPKEIPEPKAIVGLFMLGGWGIFQWRKIQQQKDKEP
ncbi:conserved exported hypothetical protein [Planktothrix serta PCC 8927]|uniref:PEP-CTERM sorting domain-containing protein n=1 Tax=Planktothrix serta PCC 8927 TaxID=671068 RepID=A0A7Z9E517_9CYAN|nr:hypothetical protein [Planktothrix serta]VXD25184.1 conserved exported hypothetical protein [Planktothrix serta PCC 8927]